LENLVGQLIRVIETLSNGKVSAPHVSADYELQQAALALKSLLNPRDVSQTVPDTLLEFDAVSEVECSSSTPPNAYNDSSIPPIVDEEMEDELGEESNLQNTSEDPTFARFGSRTPTGH
ncbi:hypothetical protein QQZ08_004424, partial [Neonectria magnoliae]